jgi:hypothetical protein
VRECEVSGLESEELAVDCSIDENKEEELKELEELEELEEPGELGYGGAKRAGGTSSYSQPISYIYTAW